MIKDSQIMEMLKSSREKLTLDNGSKHMSGYIPFKVISQIETAGNTHEDAENKVKKVIFENWDEVSGSWHKFVKFAMQGAPRSFRMTAINARGETAGYTYDQIAQYLSSNPIVSMDYNLALSITLKQLSKYPRGKALKHYIFASIVAFFSVNVFVSAASAESFLAGLVSFLIFGALAGFIFYLGKVNSWMQKQLLDKSNQHMQSYLQN